MTQMNLSKNRNRLLNTKNRLLVAKGKGVGERMECKVGVRGDLQDGRGVRYGDHLPAHKYTRNTSTCGTAPTEHLLNAGRRPQTSQKARNPPHTWVGQKKKKKQTKE